MELNPNQEPDLSPDDVLILVMGEGGTGKTSFIKSVIEKDIPITDGLQSEPPAVSLYPYPLDENRRLILVDMPAFGDSMRSDSELLATISSWMAAAYNKGITPHGIIFLHRITDNRMGDAATKRLKLYWRLWGSACLKNLVFATTMWDQLRNPALGEARMKQLTTDPLFWEPFIREGARFGKVTDRQSALDMIDLLRDARPVPLRIQTQLVNQKLTLADTAAGGIVDGNLRAMQKRYKRLMKEPNARWFRPRADPQDVQTDPREKGANKADHDKLEKQRVFLRGRWWTDFKETILSIFRFRLRSPPPA